MYTTYVRCTDAQFRLSLNHNAPVLLCSDVCQDGGQIFRLTAEQKKAYESMSKFDNFILSASLYSPIWGDVNITYERSPKPFEGALPIKFSGLERIAYAKAEVLSDSEVILQLPEKENGFSRFEYLLKVVKKEYCKDVYAFCPNEWEFLPRPRFSDFKLNIGLNAIRERWTGDIIGYDYMIDTSAGKREPQKKKLMDIINLY